MAGRVKGRNNCTIIKKEEREKVKEYKGVTLIPILYRLYINISREVEKRDS